MSTEDKMTIDERRKYLRTMKKRYVESDRKERGRLLDEMEAVTGMHRKSLTRLMNGSLERKPRRKQRGHTYGPEVDDALRVISESLDHICADRLTPNLVWMVTHLAAHGEIDVSHPLLEQLERISISTVKRRLRRLGQDRPRLPRKGPRQANEVTREIPMKRIAWDEREPGHFEVDLVHHCGSSASGEYACTLQMIDVATGWSERVAVLGRSYLVMQDAFRRIVARLPFPIREIHPDNGSEFLNHHMVRFWGELVQGVLISRSRPYQKNDNRNVEQKNATLVRAYLGHDRIDSVAQVNATNELYDEMWVYYNLFQPVMHLIEKTVVLEDGQPTRVKRKHDQAQTPFDRLCATDAITQQQREQLEALRDQTNPRQLRQEIYASIDRIFSLPGAVPGTTEDVFQTLATHSSPEQGEDDA
ncbi:MAG: transposase family protein [Chloroflexi bacterium]|nr:transposase family protein [Chloroflexota bacterium]